MRHSFLTALPSLKDNSTEMSSNFMRMSMMETKLDTIVKALQSDVSTKESERRITPWYPKLNGSHFGLPLLISKLHPQNDWAGR